ncbi:MAG TPA: DAK2 domain-containing protein, partial [Propionibacteriaceae bacterium]
ALEESALEESGGADASDWSAALTAAVAGLQQLGGAQVGDRTMVDAIHPAATALAKALAAGGKAEQALSAAVAAAEDGTRATAHLTARLGRSSYVGDRALGVVDPGAHAVALWLAAVRDALASSG